MKWNSEFALQFRQKLTAVGRAVFERLLKEQGIMSIDQAKIEAEEITKAKAQAEERQKFAVFVIVLLVVLAIVSKDASPPRPARFALLLIPKRNREHLIGDLDEEYRTVVLPEYGRFWAGFWYWGQTFWAIGPYLWKGLKRVVGWAAVIKLIGG